MHVSVHRVRNITLGHVKPLRENGAAEGPIYSYLRYIVIEYEEDAKVKLVCHSDDRNKLYLIEEAI